MVRLVWNSAAAAQRKIRFSRAQAHVDGQCIKLMQPYVPVAKPSYANAGRLAGSVKCVKPGIIVFYAPMARNDYYGRKNHAHGGNPRGRRLWFEYMKRQHGSQILRETARIAGGGAQ